MGWVKTMSHFHVLNSKVNESVTIVSVHITN